MNSEGFRKDLNVFSVVGFQKLFELLLQFFNVDYKLGNLEVDIRRKSYWISKYERIKIIE